MERRWNAQAKQNFNSNSVRSFREIQSIYFSMLFSLAAYLALWLRPIPVRPGEMKQTDALARTLLLVRRVERFDFLIRKKIYCRPTIIFRSSKKDSNRTSFHPIGHLLIYVLCEVIGLFGFRGFVPDRFLPALFEFDARFHYSDCRTEPSQNGGK